MTLKTRHALTNFQGQIRSILQRQRHLDRIRWLFRTFPIVALLGPRQIGKTTLAESFAGSFGGATTHFDLENPRDVARLSTPLLALEELQGLVVLDEIQRRPEIFEILRVLADRPEATTQFLVLGNASPDLLRQSSETLAGRITYHRLRGLALDEIRSAGNTLPFARTEDDPEDLLWLRGGFPRSFLAPGEAESTQWRLSFIRTFLERDLPQLGSRVPAETLHRFWSMVAHYHAQTWNGSELDLLIVAGVRRLGFEIKRTSAPRITRSMRSALEDLQLDHLTVLHAGRDTFPPAENVQAVAAGRLLEDVEPLR